MPGHTVVIVPPGIAGAGPGLVTNTANIILTILHNHTPHLLAVNQSLMQDASSSVMQIWSMWQWGTISCNTDQELASQSVTTHHTIPNQSRASVTTSQLTDQCWCCFKFGHFCESLGAFCVLSNSGCCSHLRHVAENTKNMINVS